MSVTSQFNMVGGSTRYGMFEDFVGQGNTTLTVSGAFTGISENSGTAAVLASQEDGVFELVTGTSSGNRSMVVSDLNYQVKNGPIVMEAGFCLHSSLLLVEAFVGFTDLMTINNPLALDSGTTVSADCTANAVGFVFGAGATNAANWYVVGYKASTATTPILTTGFPLAADVYQALRVEIDQLGNAQFFINGNQVGASSLNTSTSQSSLVNASATTALYTPVVCVESRTSAAKTGYVDYIYCQKGRVN